VIEVDRPNRQLRRRAGKSDTIDAVEAARAALSGRASGIAKSADGDVEAIRVLLVTRRSGRNTRIKYLNQIRHLGFTAPDDLRERFDLSGSQVGMPSNTGSLHACGDRERVTSTPIGPRHHGQLELNLLQAPECSPAGGSVHSITGHGNTATPLGPAPSSHQFWRVDASARVQRTAHCFRNHSAAWR
jgi:hypothetical protein